jgi:hypothetical protein
MGSVYGDRNVKLDSSAYEWPSEFYTRQKSSYMSQNEPSITRLIVTGYMPETADDILKTFLKHLDDDAEPHHYQPLAVEDFCSNVDFNVLKDGQDPRVSKPMALLDDRNSDGVEICKAGNWRSNYQPLCMHRLFLELRKKVRNRGSP